MTEKGLTEMPKLIVPSKIEWLNLAGRKGYAINPYRGCAYGCLYCWSRELQGISYEDWCQPKLRPAFRDIDIPALVKQVPEDANILLSASTDFFQHGLDPDADELRLTATMCFVAGAVSARGSSLWVLSKAPHLEMLTMLFHEAGTRIGTTITSLVPNKWEPHIAEPSERLKSLKAIHQSGSFTYISIEPWLEGITSPQSIINATSTFCDWWIIGSHNKRMRAINPDFYRRELPKLLNWLGENRLTEKVYIKKELRRLTNECESNQPLC